MMRGSAAGPSSLHKITDISRKNPDLRTQSSHVNHVADFSASSIKKEQGREHGMVKNNLLFIMSSLVCLL